MNTSGDSKSPAARRAGSSPAPGTILKIKHLAVLDFFLPESIGAKTGQAQVQKLFSYVQADTSFMLTPSLNDSVKGQ